MTGSYIKRKLKKYFENCLSFIKNFSFYFKRFWDRRLIKNRDFTLISNNCWGGHAYRYFGRNYTSPTVGLYFSSKDYLKFVYNLRYYLSLDLKFIPLEGSRFEETVKKSGKKNVPIGVLDDVYIVFLHYKTEEEAYKKWNRRKERVNFDNIIIKFSDLGPASEETLKKFSELPFENKFMIVNKQKKDYNCEVLWKGLIGKNGDARDAEDFPGNLNIRKLLDKKKEEYPIDGYIFSRGEN